MDSSLRVSKLGRLVSVLLLFAAVLSAATAHLYNLKTGQVLDMKYSRWKGGRKVSIKLPNGEIMNGEYSTVTEGSVA